MRHKGCSSRFVTLTPPTHLISPSRRKQASYSGDAVRDDESVLPETILLMWQRKCVSRKSRGRAANLVLDAAAVTGDRNKEQAKDQPLTHCDGNGIRK